MYNGAVMDAKAKNIFFLGKGGVGKSTSAALTALFLARRGLRTLVVSLDPAHNQADIFETRLSDKPHRIVPGLEGIEVDQAYWIRRYLKDIQRQIQHTYTYLTAFNLEKYFKVIKYSPGLEEYALILAYQEILRRYADHDVLIFDMAPTALSLKFFNLPRLSLIWVEHLLALRREIIKKRELITKIKLVKREIEQDKIVNRIHTSMREYQTLKNIFEDHDNTRIYLVLNPDPLSRAESLRILNGLEEINIPVNCIVLNKVTPANGGKPLDPAFSRIPQMTLSLSTTALIGVDNLDRYLASHEEMFARHLTFAAAHRPHLGRPVAAPQP